MRNRSRFWPVFSLLLLASASGGAERRSAVVIAVERVAPAVVNVSTEQVVEREVAPFPGWRDPMFDQFFRDFFEPRRRRMTRTHLGSGVVIRDDGYVLTNQHVVLRAQRITVTLVDQREFEAQLVGADADSDLAVLRLDTRERLPSVKLGRSDDLMIGETVIAIGNPFGLSHTVTTGVISATGRSLRSGDQEFYDLIQTDASINPGNSGGPLLNIDGELIGVNAAIYQNAQGIGFAIPIDRARRIVADLIQYGEVQPAWLGLLVQDLTPELALHFGARAGAGVLVRVVESDGPADAAGVRPGDVILALGTHAIHSADEWERRLHDLPIGEAAQITLLRGATRLSVDVRGARFPPERADAIAWDLLGLRLREAEGVLGIVAVRAGSEAERIGIRPGDVLAALAGNALSRHDEFRRRLAALRYAQRVLVSIRRGRRVYHVPLSMQGPAS
jgi:Do/DeqQ family serine protease